MASLTAEADHGPAPTLATPAGGRSAVLPWSTAWRIARRDLAVRFRGLRLLLACLFLGTLALAAIGTLTAAIDRELASRGQVLLGGDVELAVYGREANADELAAMRAEGQVSAGKRLQAMAVAERDRGLAVPVELKSVDAAWPLYGRLLLDGGRAAGAPRGMTAWIAPGVADRMDVKPGDRLIIGDARLTVGGIIADEPDRLGEGFSLGAAVIVSEEALAASRLVQPGSMVQSKYRLRLPEGAGAAAVGEQLEQRFPEGGWRVRDRSAATPGLERFVGRLGQFLTLVALTALAIAGIGIGNGVTSYLEARRASIATLKILGASGGDIVRTYLLQVGTAATVAVAAGLAAGVAVTPLLAAAIGELLPVAVGVIIEPLALARAAAFGLLIAAVFAAPPLLRARAFPAMAVLRAGVVPLADRWRSLLLPVGGGLAAIAALAMAGTSEPWLTAAFLAGAAVLFGLLALIGWGIRQIAARLPRPRQPILRMALANLHRPGAHTGALVTALGFALAAFVLLAAVQSSLDNNIVQRVPRQAPDYFVLDLPREGAAQFAALVERSAPGAAIRATPNLRGSILAYGPQAAMTRVADLETIPEGAWPLRGERGLTYADQLPPGNVLTAGRWWPADYRGEPLVSVDQNLAQSVGLRLGDMLTISLLGVERSARIASFRNIDWDSLGFNHVLVFSPNTLADAPHNLAATVSLAGGGDRPADRKALLAGLVRAFPATSVIEVGPVVRRARDILEQMGAATFAAASVAILAGLVVLIGALAAARASRLYDNVILRVLGASRGQLLILQLAEYALLTAALAVVALALGTLGAWVVIVEVFEFAWLPDWPRVLGVLALGAGTVLGFAIAASLPLLRAKPVRVLREL